MSIYLNGMFPVPINHAVLNDKGDMLVAVGDSLDVYVYGVENDKIQEYAIFTGKLLFDGLILNYFFSINFNI